MEILKNNVTLLILLLFNPRIDEQQTALNPRAASESDKKKHQAQTLFTGIASQFEFKYPIHENDYTYSLFYLWKSYWQQMGDISRSITSRIHRRVKLHFYSRFLYFWTGQRNLYFNNFFSSNWTSI